MEQHIEKKDFPRSAVLYRFLFFYFILYVFPVPLPFNTLPIWGRISQSIEGAFYWATNILHQVIYGELLQLSTNTVSADRKYDYLLLLVFLFLALAMSIIWPFVQRRKQAKLQFNLLLQWVLRYYLFYAMLLYGLKKAFFLQFTTPSYLDLITAQGSVSPMRLAWNFYGISPTYSFVMGCMEIIGAFLLLNKKTVKTGCILLLLLLVNILLINFEYNVPLKQYTLHLIGMNLILLAPYTRELYCFITSKTFQEKKVHPTLGFEWKLFGLRLQKNTIKGVLILGVLAMATLHTLALFNNKENSKLEEEIEGYYVNSERDTRFFEGWKGLILEHNTRAVLMKENRVVEYIPMAKSNSNAYVLNSTSPKIPTYQIEAVAQGLLIINLTTKDSVVLKDRIQKKDFLLMQREWSWVQERAPFSLDYNFK